jgi:hypothetical protein
MLAVTDSLQGARRTDDPPALLNVIGAKSHFRVRRCVNGITDALLANRVVAASDGHYYEHTEIWSEREEVLVSAQLMRRNQESPS